MGPVFLVDEPPAPSPKTGLVSPRHAANVFVLACLAACTVDPDSGRADFETAAAETGSGPSPTSPPATTNDPELPTTTTVDGDASSGSDAGGDDPDEPKLDVAGPGVDPDAQTPATRSTSCSGIVGPLTSEGSPQSWFDTVVAAKGGIETNAVMVTLSHGTRTCPPDFNAGELPGGGLEVLPTLFTHGFQGCIDDDFGEIFSSAIDVVSTACTDFTPVG